MSTLGRPHTSDFVTELIIQYSDDGDIWKTYTDAGGQDQVEFYKLSKSRSF